VSIELEIQANLYNLRSQWALWEAGREAFSWVSVELERLFKRSIIDG